MISADYTRDADYLMQKIVGEKSALRLIFGCGLSSGFYSSLFGHFKLRIHKYLGDCEVDSTEN